MTTRRTREETKAETRRRLIEAAEQVVATYGFDRATVDEIAREAGLTTGAVYSNFGGRDDLLTEVLRRRYSHRIPPTGQLDGDTVAEILDGLGAMFAGLPDDGVGLAGSLDLMLFALRSPRAKEMVAGNLSSGLQQLADALVSKGAERDRAGAIATVAVAQFLGLLELRSLLGRAEVPDEMFAGFGEVVDAWAGALSGEGS